MLLEGNVSSKPTRKCARTVGQVIGRFHPHGDSSVYDAMVRMSQDWKMRYPMINFQGNNGSIDGDGPAAYRYTEARLAEIADLMVQDLNKKTVDMQLNFDDLEFEPIVLPSRIPNLLINGSSGVAVGASTDIPPHNLSEVIDAINYRISHKKCEVTDLLEFVKGPDFPTGGVIRDSKTLKSLYETGKGLIKLYARAHCETSDKAINQIIISEIPFGKDKSDFVLNIDKCRFANKLDAILEVRDETDMSGVRIAIDIKKESDPENILNFLYSKGVLSNSIKFNMLVIDHNRPRVLSLLQVIDCFIEHQIDVITRRSEFDLEKAKSKLHIVEGLIKAVSILDKVISLIRSSKDKQDSKNRLIGELGFSEAQAEALLMMQLYRLSNTDVSTLVQESKDLKQKIDDLNEILQNPDKMNRLIKSDLNAIKNKYGDERKTTIEESALSFEVDKRALVAKDEVVISFTKDGYLKRSFMKSYNSSQSLIPGVKQGDVIKGILKCFTTDYLICITNFGNYISIPVYILPDTKWKEEGHHINQFGSISPNEKIVGGFVYSKEKENVHVILITKLGQIKRTEMLQFEPSQKPKPIKCFRLGLDDEIVSFGIGKGRTDILVVDENGYCSLYSENSIEPVGIKAGGVKSITPSKDKAHIAGLLTFEPNEKGVISVITDGHGIKLIDSSSLEKSIRLGPKQQLFKTFKNDPQKAVFVSKYAKNEIDKSIFALFENQETIEIDISEQKVQSIGNNLKRNMDKVQNPFNIVDCYRFDVPYIEENTVTYEPVVKKIEVKKEELKIIKEPIKDIFDDDEEDKKISLFDFVDDD